jgi:hypothetical protein
MGVIWNTKVAVQAREEAITRIEDLELGRTYYCTNGEKIEIRELHQCKKDGTWWYNCNPNKDPYPALEGGSLLDRNVGDGAGYNPWFLFTDSDRRDYYVKALEISFFNEPEFYDGWEVYDLYDE